MSGIPVTAAEATALKDSFEAAKNRRSALKQPLPPIRFSAAEAKFMLRIAQRCDPGLSLKIVCTYGNGLDSPYLYLGLQPDGHGGYLWQPR